MFRRLVRGRRLCAQKNPARAKGGIAVAGQLESATADEGHSARRTLAVVGGRCNSNPTSDSIWRAIACLAGRYRASVLSIGRTTRAKYKPMTKMAIIQWAIIQWAIIQWAIIQWQ
jgi:hypothetical protein